MEREREREQTNEQQAFGLPRLAAKPLTPGANAPPMSDVVRKYVSQPYVTPR